MCFEFDALPPRVPADRAIPALIAGGAAAEILTLESADGTKFSAAFAECPEPIGGPAVIVLPDVRGLYRFYIDLAERFVTAGYHAVAIDYFGRTAGVGERDDSFDYITHTMQTNPAQVQADIAAAREPPGRANRRDDGRHDRVLLRRRTVRSGRREPAARSRRVISFYGTLVPRSFGADNPDFPAPLKRADEIRTPVLALFGGADPRDPARGHRGVRRRADALRRAARDPHLPRRAALLLRPLLRGTRRSVRRRLAARAGLPRQGRSRRGRLALPARDRSTSCRRVASSSSPIRAAGSAAELCQQLRGLLAAGVVLPDEEPVQARFSQAARVHGAGVALKERERDRAVQIPEQAQRTGPEPLKLRAQLVTQRGPGANQVLSCSGQRPERLSLIAVGLQARKRW